MIQNNLRREVLESHVLDPTAETFDELPYLTAVVAEALRLYPPIPQLMNRLTQAIVQFGDIGELPKGTWVGWHAYGVHTDPKVWGPTARDFVPERWGAHSDVIHTRMRRETARGAYIPFNSHSRKCMGEGFALLEVKIALFELVRRVKWHVPLDSKVVWRTVGVL